MLTFLALLFARLFAPSAPVTPPPPSSMAEPVAVVELFTSEGCSSCPPADRVLTELVEEAAAGDAPVYALSFHVDYWNYLGWADPFSDAAYSQRQRQYAKTLRSSVYTPQLIVNGHTELVGSRGREVRDHVQRALRQKADVRIEARMTRQDGSARIDYTLHGDHSDQEIHIALVEREVTVDVRRGENRGRTLHHDNVVRAFLSQPATPTGTATLSLPPDVDTARLAVIIYSQRSGPGAVTGASRLAFAK